MTCGCTSVTLAVSRVKRSARSLSEQFSRTVRAFNLKVAVGLGVCELQTNKERADAAAFTRS